MDFIDHPILYSDDCAYPEWQRLVEQSKKNEPYWRRVARKKMRRVVKELLSGKRPRIQLGYDL